MSRDQNTPDFIPFGDPRKVSEANAAAVRKGVFFGLGGCLLVGFGVLLLIAAPFLIFKLVTRSNEATQVAMAELQKSPEILALLGQPVRQHGDVYGSTSYNKLGKEVDLHFPIKGSRQSGQAHLIAEKRNAQWRILLLEVQLQGQIKPLVLQSQPSSTANADEDPKLLPSEK